jgi:MFS family permease
VADVTRLSARSAERRFVLLTALRWLPVGFVVPVTVLLAASRGLSPVEIGLAFTAHGVVIVLLELPTGGLADALGRRPVLLLSGVLNLAGLVLLALAQDPWGFAVAYAVIGVGRALDSGPLEAWFVDALHEADPGADPARGLSRAGVADGAALAVGALAGGGLPLLFGQSLVAPFVAAAGFTAVGLVAVALLVVPVGPVRTSTGPWEALRGGVADVPRVVTTALRLAARERTLRLLMLIALGTGPVLVSIELLAPLRFAELVGGEAAGGQAYSVVVTLGFGAAALGSALALQARRAAGGSSRRATAALMVVAAGGLALMAVDGSVVVLAAGALVFSLCNGASWPLRKHLLHERVDAAHRATMVSASSLALQLGGILSNQVQPRVYEAYGPAWAFGLAAVVLHGLGALSLRLTDPPSGDEEPLLDETLHDGQHLLSGVGLGQPGTAGQDGQQVTEAAGPVAAGEQRRAVRVDPA